MSSSKRISFKLVLFSTAVLLISNLAFASSFGCWMRASKNRTEATGVVSGPKLQILTYYKECFGGDPLRCSSGIDKIFAGPHSLCFQDINVLQDCLQSENNESLEVNCKNGTSLKFIAAPNQQGKLICSVPGALVETWFLGNCRPQESFL